MSQLNEAVVKDRIFDTISAMLGVHKDTGIHLDATLEDLGADSLDLVELSMGIEEALDDRISAEELEDKINGELKIGELIDFVVEKICT